MIIPVRSQFDDVSKYFSPQEVYFSSNEYLGFYHFLLSMESHIAFASLIDECLASRENMVVPCVYRQDRFFFLTGVSYVYIYIACSAIFLCFFFYMVFILVLSYLVITPRACALKTKAAKAAPSFVS